MLYLGHLSLQHEGPLDDLIVPVHLFLQLLQPVDREFAGRDDAGEGACQRPGEG